MSITTADESMGPAGRYALATLGSLLTGAFCYATFSPLSPVALKVSFVAGVVFSLLAQISYCISKDPDDEDKTIGFRILPFGCICFAQGVMAFQHAIRAIFARIFPETLLTPISHRNVACFGAFSLGFAVTHLVFETYHYYRSRQTVSPSS